MNSDCVTASTIVTLDPNLAFEVFTEEIDLWWRRGPRFRWIVEGNGRLRFEGGPGGRLVEIRDEASGEEFEVGRILTWSPGERLVFDFRLRAFQDEERTEVEIRFEAVEAGTRVTIEHRGWDSISADHAARHGLVGPAFRSMLGLWWGDQLVSLRSDCRGRTS